ncbi:TonB-dependent receptor [Flavisolibacter tropicus]|uniref:TonB-dependent receptor n=1 Tax=Flavisolibacter tropicus TaxID=1492898 RepID=A0A172U287_9BACT|nr:TonB-dependent receptor [Flavisolibacter tropicus]
MKAYPTSQHTIVGVVLEEDQKGGFKPLVGASVIWLGTTIGTATDSAGVFTIANTANSSRLVVSYAGYQPDTLAVVPTKELKIILAQGKQLNEVKVTAGGRPATYINAYDPFRTAIMTRKELLKAACCNLSESFETNPSVDVSYNDAVTGSKQIQLLGLSGNYTQLTVENLPGPRGLATSQGLNSIPGTWIESIQLIKGIGSVANGFESIAGQINLELKKPVTSERLFANVYVNDFGKTDLNLNLTQKVGKKWATTLLLHDAFLKNKSLDFNGDGFKDLPTGNLFSAVNRWSYDNNKGLMTQFGVKMLEDQKTGGQVTFDPSKHKLTTDVYGLGINTSRIEAFGKIGYVFPEKKYKSIGLQLSAFNHDQDSYFGLTTYNGEQQNFYSNLIYQSIIGNSQHKFRTGLSFVSDQYKEQFNGINYNRRETVPGGFFEYTYSPLDRLDVVAGIREDYNNLYGWFTTPRLNIRYEPIKGTTIRGSIGRGQRTANIFAENNSVLVSARTVNILPATVGKAYGLNPEVAWNKGISVDQKFKLFNRNSSLSVEYFRNDFQDQVVVDLEDPRTVSFYNLNGKSFSNSFQTELTVEPLRKLNVRLAYRYFDVNTTFSGSLLERPFTAKNRGFANIGYEINGWKLDYTVNYNGRKRIPSTASNPVAYQLDVSSPAYVLMNAQVSKTLGKNSNVDLYLGGENLTNYFQKDVIISADQPFSPYFDASMIWGPVIGRMFYGGIRYSLK